jgi:short-subunit dehydrogenase
MIAETQHKTAWVTGAGKGIGRALVKHLTKDGWTVAISSRTASDLVALAAECPAESVRMFPLDVTDAEVCDRVAGSVFKALGPLDLAVLNAGTHKAFEAKDFSVDPVRQLVEVNLMGTVNTLAAVMPRAIQQGRGQIAVVASLAGYRGLPTASAYGATKAALINMCEALRPDLARHGIKLQVINPGFVKTPLTDRNDFPMPFLISAPDAAALIVQGLGTDRFEISFPRRFATIMKVLRLLPDRLFFALTRRMIEP